MLTSPHTHTHTHIDYESTHATNNNSKTHSHTLTLTHSLAARSLTFVCAALLPALALPLPLLLALSIMAAMLLSKTKVVHAACCAAYEERGSQTRLRERVRAGEQRRVVALRCCVDCFVGSTQTQRLLSNSVIQQGTRTRTHTCTCMCACNSCCCCCRKWWIRRKRAAYTVGQSINCTSRNYEC